LILDTHHLDYSVAIFHHILCEWQIQVLDELAKWTKNSPITIKDNNAIKVQKDVLKKEKEASEKFLENSLDYVHEWQLIVQTRVDASQKQAKDLKNTLDHYEKKVANLTKSREKDLEKDKPVDGDAEDKYKRNEEKLALAREAYESHATDLCNLLEAIVNGAWKDIMPVLIKMMTLEATKLEERNKIVETSNVVTNMKNLAEEYKIDLTTPAPTKAKVVPKNDAKKVSPE